ncbi:hypothetical protein 8014-B2_00126 [Lactobacillus phage ATCC 8014-B2]|uniref:Uncharacterized protein n=1 Tax=Lactobacillus phage ATCC 8014-B2 TaxID=1225795 RepID=K4I0M5_9CAUD|nr:hypothetical protein HOQ89_gp020 [Lactobacillus phage ATCC 8014-B2]AFU63193.1 hypothetical protein 8014-B2_00126 [Lactobacillus phage ATCC 8014-B2]
MKTIKLIMVIAVSFVGTIALLTTSAKAFSITGVQLTRVNHENYTNVAITNPTHKDREYHVIVKPAGQKALKLNTYIQAGETVEVYTPVRHNGGILYNKKLPKKFAITVYRMSSKQSKYEMKHGYVNAGIKWTKHTLTNK